ncbi:MAG: hypothetical protein DRN25_03580, partial [Thermoplasmata archaeon]
MEIKGFTGAVGIGALTIGFVSVLFLIAAIMPALASGSASLWTADESGTPQTDFHPGDIVYIHGEGFNPDSPISISVTRPDNSVDSCDANSCSDRFLNGSQMSDSNGNFVYQYNLDGITGDYLVEASDGENSATTVFSDCSCSSWTSPEACISNGCYWCEACNGKKGSQYYPNDKCVNTADDCQYSCNENCGAECDSDLDCTPKCDRNVYYYNGFCDGESCQCAYASQEDCDDNIACTIDSCDPVTGCSHQPDNSLCDDGNPCTLDTCDPQRGCIHDETSMNGQACDDNNLCTLNDVCVNGVCQGIPKDCDDNNPCTEDSCNPDTGECVFQFNDDQGPNTYDVNVDPYYNNGLFTTTATTEDECSVIKTAKYYIGHSTVGSCSEIAAEQTGTIYPEDDGSFDLDKLKEYLAGNYAFYRDGLNYICIQAQDNADNWGNCACAYFETDTVPPDCPYDIYLDDVLYPDEYLICGDNAWLNATVCDQESYIQGGEYFIDLEIPPIPEPWSGFWMDPVYNFTRNDGWHCAVIGAEVDTSQLEDGTHYIRIRGKDTAENWGKIAQCQPVISFIRDTTPPVTQKELNPADGKKVNCYGNEADDANVGYITSSLS